MGNKYTNSAIGYVIALAVISTALAKPEMLSIVDKMSLTLIGGYAGSTLMFFTNRFSGTLCRVLQDITGFGAALFVFLKVWGVNIIL